MKSSYLMTVTSLTKSLMMEGFYQFALSAFSPQTDLGRVSLRQGLELSLEKRITGLQALSRLS